MCASQFCISVVQLINNYNNTDNYNKLKSKIRIVRYVHTMPILINSPFVLLLRVAITLKTHFVYEQLIKN